MISGNMKNKFFFMEVALFLVVFSGCGDRAETHVGKEARQAEIRDVKVSRVKASGPTGSMEYIGVLTAHCKASVACEAGGTIEHLYFEKGDRVVKGQLLAEISTRSMAILVRQAKAAVAAARITLEKIKTGSRPEEIAIAEALLQEVKAVFFEAQRNFKRIKELHESGAAANSEYDSGKRAMEMARAKLHSAQQQVSLMRQGPRIEDRRIASANLEQALANLALAEDRLRRSRLCAPCDGIIAFREVEEGEVIVMPPITVITQIVDLSRLKISLSLGERDVHVLEKHKEFKFTSDAIPNKEFTCRLLFRSPTADPVTRSFPVELEVENPDLRMADGMTVRVIFPVVDKNKYVKIPTSWLAEESGNIGLLVVIDGKAIFKKVTLGAYYDRRVEILSGIGEGETVITNPAGVKSGERVRYGEVSNGH